MTYRDVYEAWKADPEAFWMAEAEKIDWDQKPTRALNDDNAPLYEWFTDGMVNTCWNAVDRHVAAGHGDRNAIIYDSPVTGTVRHITYAELRDQVARLAGALAERGVTKGDRVVIYMPMVPEALMAMLACTRIGAIHSVVFGGFAANELAVRLEGAQALQRGRLLGSGEALALGLPRAADPQRALGPEARGPREAVRPRGDLHLVEALPDARLGVHPEQVEGLGLHAGEPQGAAG